MKKNLLLINIFFTSVTLFAQTTNTFPTSGNVGIGTMSPTTSLSINSTSELSFSNNPAVLSLRSKDAFSMNMGGGIAFGGLYSGTSQTTFGYIGGVKENLTSGNFAGKLVFGTRADGTGGDDMARMVITSTGNVGIGVATPSAKLTIKGVSEMSFTNNPALLSLYSTDANALNMGGGIVFGGVYTGSSQTTFGYIGGVKESTSDGNFAGKLVFGTRVNGVGGDDMTRMVLTSNGNLGIGITSPAERLSVAGNISADGYITARKMTVTQLGWSDYVFERTYKLRSLRSLENFIMQHNHLPNVPSAKEVAQNGINVGDNQALLLKKIEELTLYIIGQQKQIDVQNKRIQSLEKKSTN